MSDLFNWAPHARTTDPSTSHEAAAEINITEQAWKILQAYRNGEALLDHDAYQRVGFGPNARDGQRCSDLRQKGLIERAGRGITPSGRSGYLCRITERGRAYLASNGRGAA